MILTLSPIRSAAALTLARAGDALVVNGVRFDFTPLPAGGVLPREAIGSEWFAGDASRDEDGTLRLSLILPHGPGASENRRFPEPIEATGDGPIALPE